MTTNLHHLVSTPMPTPNHDRHDDPIPHPTRTTPSTPTPTDTCHLFEEAPGSVVSTPC